MDMINESQAGRAPARAGLAARRRVDEPARPATRGGGRSSA